MLHYSQNTDLHIQSYTTFNVQTYISNPTLPWVYRLTCLILHYPQCSDLHVQSYTTFSVQTYMSNPTLPSMFRLTCPILHYRERTDLHVQSYTVPDTIASRMSFQLLFHFLPVLFLVLVSLFSCRCFTQYLFIRVSDMPARSIPVCPVGERTNFCMDDVLLFEYTKLDWRALHSNMSSWSWTDTKLICFLIYFVLFN